MSPGHTAFHRKAYKAYFCPTAFHFRKQESKSVDQETPNIDPNSAEGDKCNVQMLHLMNACDEERDLLWVPLIVVQFNTPVQKKTCGYLHFLKILIV